jgi:hypothetical protein
MPSIAPVNITAAALLAQFAFVVTLFVAAIMVAPRARRLSELPWVIFAIALITIGALISSDELSHLWKPLFGNPSIRTISSATALLLMFIFNIVVVVYLVTYTGGSRASPFTSLYFLLPVLALFLRESVARVIWYSVAVSVLYSVNLVREDYGDGVDSRLAEWWVSVAAFVLAMVVGLITRPQ